MKIWWDPPVWSVQQNLITYTYSKVRYGTQFFVILFGFVNICDDEIVLCFLKQIILIIFSRRSRWILLKGFCITYVWLNFQVPQIHEIRTVTLKCICWQRKCHSSSRRHSAIWQNNHTNKREDLHKENNTANIEYTIAAYLMNTKINTLKNEVDENDISYLRFT